MGDWGLGFGDWGLGPIPNPQSPIPNPQYKFYSRLYLKFKIIKFSTKYLKKMEDKKLTEEEIVDKVNIYA